MNRALLITVGTGIGAEKEEAIKSLAHGIVASIRNSNPDYIVFIVTEESKTGTIPEIKNLYPELPDNEPVLIKDMNDVNSIYQEITEKIKELKSRKYDVVIDFTSGTKAMSASAVLAATSEAVMLSYVSGKRIGGKVVKGEEQVLSYSPVKGIVDFQEKILKELFNTYQYESCLEIIRRIGEMTSDPDVVEKLSRYRQLAEGYSLWDKFEHKKALEMLRTFDNSLVNIEENKRTMFSMEEGGYKDYRLLICDLMNNAKRRGEEGKYDDAVARLYRITELIAQSVLRTKYEITSSDVDVWQLKSLDMMEKNTVEKYEKLRDEKGTIKLPLKKDFELLNDLGDEIGKKFLADNRMKDMLAKRNNSILAHDLVPVAKEDAEKMFEIVKEYVELVVEDVAGLMKKSDFQKL
jgi:CRISPR-associated protein (TIGR02710 family)